MKKRKRKTNVPESSQCVGCNAHGAKNEIYFPHDETYYMPMCKKCLMNYKVILANIFDSNLKSFFTRWKSLIPNWLVEINDFFPINNKNILALCSSKKHENINVLDNCEKT